MFICKNSPTWQKIKDFLCMVQRFIRKQSMNYRFLAIALGAVYLTACGGREVSLPSTPSIVVPADNLVTGSKKSKKYLPRRTNLVRVLWSKEIH